jgi:hypothetical protein
MAKIIMDVSSADLVDLLGLPVIARLMDDGRVSIQPDDLPVIADQSSTRQKGRETFERRARQHGLIVKTFSQPGVSDFVVNGPANTKPVRLICSESPRISVRREWAETSDLVCAYVWLLPAGTRIFLMSYEEVTEILGDKAMGTDSFKDNGYYTTACTTRRQHAMEPFEDRWQIFNS